MFEACAPCPFFLFEDLRGKIDDMVSGELGLMDGERELDDVQVFLIDGGGPFDVSIVLYFGDTVHVADIGDERVFVRQRGVFFVVHFIVLRRDDVRLCGRNNGRFGREDRIYFCGKVFAGMVLLFGNFERFAE